MTKSTITRERLEWLSQISCRDDIEDIGGDEIRELASMALAAMDSESGCLPLDYLQGHKDGLEWAAQLAEANHPETGDWLYDDPIELAKAIRKGPDMPPAQPAADSEPVAIIDQANLDYLRSGADADVWPPEREEMGDVLLYRHAQPEPVVPKSISVRQAITALESAGAVTTIGQAYKMGWNACRSAMLAAAPQSPGGDHATAPGKWIPVSERMPDREVDVQVYCPDKKEQMVAYLERNELDGYFRFATWRTGDGIYCQPTHWMPLPAA
ncbi:DUF551 domain-containing protein, partial [Klebsiella pneumoniae]|uniref:DUF551 domain-containing protein n=1 Tax=Klebsiella pneumoniae TaxID=573 RepID=UPI003B58C2CD